MTVAFIVRENITVTEELKARLTKLISDLVVKERAITFLFADVSDFDRACYEIVSKLKSIFEDIQRVFVGECSSRECNVEWIGENYEKAVLPEKGAISFVLRDQAMIDRSDVLVTYCDMNREMNAKWKSNSVLNMAYAWKHRKRIINAFEL